MYDLLGYVRKLSIRIIIGVRINRVYELSEKIRYVQISDVKCPVTYHFLLFKM